MQGQASASTFPPLCRPRRRIDRGSSPRTKAEISWTVHLANKKAVTRNSGSAGGPDDRPRGPGRSTARTNASSSTTAQSPSRAPAVPHGSPRRDPHGRRRSPARARRLREVGVADQSSHDHRLPRQRWLVRRRRPTGPVTAHVTITSTGDEFDAVGAWVIVGPPKFAPQIDNVVTLYDRVFQMRGVAQGWVTGPANPVVHPRRLPDPRTGTDDPAGVFPGLWDGGAGVVPNPVTDADRSSGDLRSACQPRRWRR